MQARTVSGGVVLPPGERLQAEEFEGGRNIVRRRLPDCACTASREPTLRRLSDFGCRAATTRRLARPRRAGRRLARGVQVAASIVDGVHGVASRVSAV